MCQSLTWHGSFGHWHSCRGRSFSDTTGEDLPWQMFLRSEWIHSQGYRSKSQIRIVHLCWHLTFVVVHVYTQLAQWKITLCGLFLWFYRPTFHRNVLNGEAEDDSPDHSKSHLYITVHNLWKANNPFLSVYTRGIKDLIITSLRV